MKRDLKLKLLPTEENEINVGCCSLKGWDKGVARAFCFVACNVHDMYINHLFTA
jgi:hypothetical protein